MSTLEEIANLVKEQGAQIKSLQTAVNEARNEAGKANDVIEIINLQNMSVSDFKSNAFFPEFSQQGLCRYGFYISKCQYEETCDLFEEDGAVAFFGGLFKNKAGIRRLFVEKFQHRFTNKHNGPILGYLLDHPQLQPVVHVADDRLSAKMRSRSLMQAARHVVRDALYCL